MKKLLTTLQLEKIKETIQVELLKRGFTAKLTTFEEVENKGTHYISLESESFQTVPILFKEIKISNFSTNMKKDVFINVKKESIDIVKVWIQVHISYTHFEGGMNGSSLFEFMCVAFGDRGVDEIQIR